MDLQQIVFLTIDAGGTFLKSAILDKQGEVLPDSSLVTRSYSEGSKEKILWAIQETILKGLDLIFSKGMKAGGIGIAFPGPFDYHNATSLMEHKFHHIYGINLREEIYGFPGVPRDIPIRFIHDSTAVLAGEIWKGNAQGFENTAVITIGTGLGFNFSQKGVIRLNEMGGPLVPIYRLAYRSGILEDYVSKRGLLRLYEEISGQDIKGKIKVSDIGNWADAGEEHAMLTFREAGRILAESLRELIAEKEIECVLFGGQISRSFRHMEGVIREEWQNIACLKKISTVYSIENAAMLGILYSVNHPEIFV